MRNVLLFSLLLTVVLTITSPPSVLASGSFGEEADNNACNPFTLQKVTVAPVTYSFTGICNLVHTRLAVPVKVPYTAIGTYDPATGKTTEDINVPAPAINEPSRPYGRFSSSMHCATDPWRDGQGNCNEVAVSVNPPGSAWPPNDFGNYARTVISVLTQHSRDHGRPLTAYLEDAQRKSVDEQYQAAALTAAAALEAKRKAEQGALDAQRKSQLAVQGKQSLGVYLALIYPSVVTPAAAQVAVAQSPLSIKLTPPKGWKVTTYTINIQRRDASGPWVNHTSIAVNAAVAESAAGYVGFGGGAPPAFLMLPGHWRLNAEASSPKKSGVSDWVEFTAQSFTRRGRH
ncbi:MAG TPA: hypothetical protein VGJ57_05950 [Nitrospirales bacterium]